MNTLDQFRQNLLNSLPKFRNKSSVQNLRDAVALWDKYRSGNGITPADLRKAQILTRNLKSDYAGISPDSLALCLAMLQMVRGDYTDASDILDRVQPKSRIPCYQLMRIFHRSYPVFAVDFPDRLSYTFDLFQKEYDRNSAGINRKPALIRSTVMPILQELVGPSYSVAIKEKPFVAQLGIGDEPARFFGQLYLSEHAPLRLQNHWAFSVGIEWNTAEIDIDGTSQPLSAFQFTLGGKDQWGRFSISLYNRLLARVAKTDEGRAIAHATYCIQKAAGELQALAYLQTPEVLSKAPQYQSSNLYYLHSELDFKGCYMNLTPRRFLHSRKLPVPAGVSPNKLRGDIQDGYTCFPWLDSEYRANRSDSVSFLNNQGIAAAFLYFPRENVDTDPELFRRNLEWAVCSEVGEDVLFIGFAQGSTYYYFDFIAYRFRAVAEAMKKYFDTIPNGDTVRVATFFPGAAGRTLDVERELIIYKASVNASLGQGSSSQGPGSPFLKP